mmetsp:Transcript_20271/g.81577  ORF Transcript_20271/g.81577 Transcript_20271/m.81577 type:complete len:332 (-) Transcript_20271:2208-3203(-)
MEIPLLSENDVLAKLKENQAMRETDERYFAFYSSELDGVVTDPHLFLVGMDDHIVHRGHSVFDTAMVVHGQMYQLEQHLDRLLTSADKTQIDWKKSGLSKEKFRQAVFAVARATKHENQGLRFWLGAGPGGFGISPKECPRASFYCVATELKRMPEDKYTHGIKVVTSTIAMKPSHFANAKTTNYLPNVMLVMEAEAQASWQGVWVDENGNVAELGTANIGFILEKGSQTLSVPSFRRTLAGISVKRIMYIAEHHLGMKVEQRDISLSEAKQASEAFAFGGPYLTLPIVLWDSDIIGDGKVGPVARTLYEAQLRDWKDAWGDDGHLEPLRK